MKLQKVYLGLLILGIPLAFWRITIALGWVVGQTVMIVLTSAREAFYGKVLDSEKFNIRQYLSYVLFTIILIAGPLLFSFFFRSIVEPLAIFASYFLDRMLTFVINLFSKEKKTHAG